MSIVFRMIRHLVAGVALAAGILVGTLTPAQAASVCNGRVEALRSPLRPGHVPEHPQRAREHG
ncbi:MAG: hypothetical protein IPK07_20200 [Deltaproteobacteria bacterium]|nr:hypothetical protein [Deltaproteobacteria bacterium]